MRTRDWFVTGLFLAAFPVLARGQSVAQVAGVAIDTGKISWTWNIVNGATAYTVVNGENGQISVVNGNPPNAGIVESGLPTNTTHSILVGAVINGAQQSPLQASPTIYTLAQQPALPTNPPQAGVDSTFQNGFLGHFLTLSNSTDTTYAFQAVPTASGAVLTPTSLTGLAPWTTGQVNFANGTPNTEYTLSVAAINGGTVQNAQGGKRTAFAVLGTTCTEAAPPANLTVVSNTPSSLSVAWSANGNPADTAYQLLYSSDGFATTTVTPIPFSSNFTALRATVGGLLTGQLYTIRVYATNRYGRGLAHVTVPATVTATTTNGGAPTGNILVQVPAGGSASVAGTVGPSNIPVSIGVAPGSFDQIESILVATRAVASVPAGCGAVVEAFDLTATPAAQPHFPIQLSFGVLLSPPQAGVTNPGQLSVSRYDPASNACIPLPATPSVAANTIYAQTNHLSTFVVQQTAPSANLSSLTVYPNPFYVRRQAMLTFKGLPAGARVRLYTLQGEEVFDGSANGSGILAWPGTNKSGLQVASGLYLALVEAAPERAVLKVAVLR